MGNHAATVSDPETIARIGLSLTAGVGPRLSAALLEQFGNAQAVFAASEDELRAIEGVGAGVASRLRQVDHVAVERELSCCRQHDVSLLLSDDSCYPRRLREIGDFPSLLYCRGEFETTDELAVAIVGTRRPTRYGLRQAERFAAGLARCGFTVVSGLARGIDAAAHQAALAAGGRTLAVMAGGLAEVYPPEHEMLAREVSHNGALISEMPSSTRPRRGAFPRRNRLISGMSLGVIVVEAMRRSGALITARHAVEQGREVFAVPGEVDSKLSMGCHQLIRDGAKLIESLDDVLEELVPLLERSSEGEGKQLRHPAELQLNGQEKTVYDAIGKQTVSVEEIVETSGLPVHRVLSTLSVLESRRLVDRISPLRVARRN